MIPSSHVLRYLAFLGLMLCFFACQRSAVKEGIYEIEENSKQVGRIDSSYTFKGQVSAFFQDSQNNYWIGSKSSGLCVFNGHYYTYYTVQDGLVAHEITSIQEDQHGRIWVDQGAYLSVFDFTRHTSGMSSILSTSSMKSVSLEQSFRTSLHDATPQHVSNSRSIGFSELMNAADDSNVNLDVSGTSNHISNHKSIGRLPPLPENHEAECGTLISVAPEYNARDRISNDRRQKTQSWWQNIPFMESESRTENSELNSPLLTRTELYDDDSTFEPLNVTRLFSNGSHQQQSMILALERANASIETNIESDDSFEVSLLLGQNTRCSVDDVVEVISNVDLLSLWCNPIDSLIVTSSSSEGSSFMRASEEMRRSNENESSERTREYEAEWIEATTSSLETPSSSAGFILTAGQTVLQSLGCTSYGKISMFIERQHGRISLNIGPFNGGISASHSISVSLEEHSGKIRIVDRVKLTHENEEESFLLGKVLGCAMGSCLGSCFLPPIDGYVDQATLSMSRLQLLLENSVNVRSVSRSG